MPMLETITKNPVLPFFYGRNFPGRRLAFRDNNALTTIRMSVNTSPPPDSETPCGRIEKGTRCGPPGTFLAFKTAPEEVCHRSKTCNVTILRSYGELGLELPTQVESKIERKSEQNSLHDLLVISALQRLENTEAGHAPEGQSSSINFPTYFFWLQKSSLTSPLIPSSRNIEF